MNRALIALSGGVDSSVSAELLKRDGYDVGAVVMMMSDEHEKTIHAARDAAKALDIPLFELDLRREFKSEIIDYFAKEYLRGRTPSPCVRCNPKIKFKYLLQTALDNGYSYIATGHYAKIVYSESHNAYLIHRASSDKRDQSYMLAGLGQDVLSRLICPLSGMEKSYVRDMALKLGLKCHDAPDSVENCFIPDNDYARFIEQNYSRSPYGNFVTEDGVILGRHNGILHYTVGQRKGLGIALGRPAYVSRIDSGSNEVVLSFEKRTATKINLSSSFEVFPGSFSCKPDNKYYCKLRSTGALLRCVLEFNDCKMTVVLDEPYPAVSSGQAAVIYDGCGESAAVLGMGIIDSCE